MKCPSAFAAPSKPDNAEQLSTVSGSAAQPATLCQLKRVSMEGAMKRFLSSTAASSSARAELASSSSSGEHSLTASGNAEQSATPCQLKISSIRDVQRWLAKEPIASCSSADMQRIREAAAVLSHPKPKQEDVRPLQSKWQVARKKDKEPRPLGEVLHEFQGKVIKAAQKLQL